MSVPDRGGSRANLKGAVDNGDVFQWRTGSEFSTGHGELKRTLLFTNNEGFKCISAKGAHFQQKGALFA